ncbi:MAG: 2-oxoacid:acceptor oxidoreductase family protein [Treponema sp.]|nr:2-oxoacid:acceptor oxidoreductase family protein [Treponema sp.]
MTEILWHGRGGQGAFTAAKVLGAAYSIDGNYGLAFPSFGPERRGAPILAFTKLDSKSIGDRSQIKKADYVIFLDDTLFADSAFNEIKYGGKILLNTKKSLEELGINDESKKNSIVLFDGTTLAQEILKLTVTNTVMLSLLAKISGLVSEENLISALKEYMPPKVAAKNEELIRKIFEEEKDEFTEGVISGQSAAKNGNVQKLFNYPAANLTDKTSGGAR